MAIITSKKHYITDHPHFYLKGKKVMKTYDLYEWGEWMEKAGKNRVVKQTVLKNNVWVSTVFLGVDYNFLQKGKPILFETMAFDQNRKEKYQIDDGKVREGLGEELLQVRYCTYEQAEKGHKAAVAKLRRRKPSPRLRAKVKRVRTGFLNGTANNLAKGKPDTGPKAAV